MAKVTTVAGVTTVDGYSREVATVDDIKALQRYRVSKVLSGDAVRVVDQDDLFVWVGTSTHVADGVYVIVPKSYANAKAPVGRWIRESSTLDVTSSEVVVAVSQKKTVQSVTGLKAVKVNPFQTGDSVHVIDLNVRFVWRGTSRLPANDQTVIQPNSYKSPRSIGRWLLEGVLTGTGTFPSTPSTTAPSTTTNLIYPVRSVFAVDSPVVVSIEDGVVLADTSDGDVDITMPDPALIPAGRFYVIRKVDPSENVVTISAGGNVLVETYPSITMNNISGVSLISDGSNFFVLP